MIKIRAKFKKEKDMKYISHLDLMRMLQRAFRRADIPIKYSEGYNPHPKISLASALSLGISSTGEYMDIEMEKKINVDDFIKKLNNVLPEGVEIIKAEYVNNKKSLVSEISWAMYAIEFELYEGITKEDVEDNIKGFLEKAQIILKKKKKKRGRIVNREVNVREFIKDISILMFEDDRIVLKTNLKTGSRGNLKPQDLIKLLKKYTDISIVEDSIKIHRLELFVDSEKGIATPL
ncbi:TIGR03936 family radical SAM-associated protein [Caldisalinibacter kiritimatiensis]|uniref:Radical SAM domain protein n=1 Tax=Caldisalinibacter kiritimatiensis TaxID=1304284 RepID=R1AT46_9FIRM|nr:TIGR03936 family radical SAM-associated protein [Caldisalinibacter kiritimatiensis]EOC99816.1 radical SAM domain protein [Caldisalinibacter kiritimatiensis]